jgi:RNA polymerase sigma-70 factor (ECF subfamily)
MTAERQLDPAGLGDHLDRLYRTALALCGSPDDAEDLVQETYARVLARPRWLRNEDDLAYLLQALRHTFVSQRRAAARRPRAFPLVEEHTVMDHRSLMPDEAAEARLVYEVIAALPDDLRDVLVAVDVAGLSYREAARTLGVPEATVGTRLFRARQYVARLVGDPTPGSPGSEGEEQPVRPARS